MKKHKAIYGSERVKITGRILPTDVNRHGRPIEICIETETFDRYIVSSGQKGKELFNFVFSDVMVEGTIVSENVLGDPVIKIDQYRLPDVDIL
ncbi:MAG: hypothetical protein ABIL68_08825 [bacterium]